MDAGRSPAQPAMGGREWILLLVLAGLWGGSFFFVKVLVAELPPFTIVLGRVGLAALMLNLWLLLRRDFMPGSVRLWGAFIAMGVLNNVVPFSLIAFGETRIGSGLAAILNATTPLFTVFVAHLLTDNERLTPAKLAGTSVGFAGVAVLIGPDMLAGLRHGGIVGEAACLLAALTYAFASLYGRRFKGISPIKVATGQMTGSALVLIPLVALVDRPWNLAAPDAAGWGALFGIALLCTVMAYILYFRILATAGATNLMLVTFLIPVSAILLGVGVLGETLRARQVLGMALIGGGLACIDGRLLRRLGAWRRRLRPCAVARRGGRSIRGTAAGVAADRTLSGGGVYSARERSRGAPE